MTQLLQNAACGTALILAAAVLRRVLRERLIPGARLALWAACLFRLLTPVPLESALSLWGSFRPRQAPAAPVPAPVTGTPQLYTPAQTGPSPAAPVIPWETVLLTVWLAAGTVLAVYYVLHWRRTRRAVACAIPVERDDPRYLSLPKCARLREGPMEGAPLTFGAVLPTVVLPPALEGEALDCVLAHEGVHASRRDNLWHYVMAAALIVHWWNPAVWLMARLLRRDIELSCDRAALKKLGADRRADYANTLVSLATQGNGPAFCQTFGRKAAEERIRSVMKFKKTSVIGVVLSLALVLAVTAAFASEPKKPDTPDTLVVDGVTLTGDAAKYASQLHAGMTRDEVHQLLGEPHNFLSGLYGDTYLLERLQGLPVTEPATEAPLFIIYYDYEDFNGGVSKVERVVYRVGDGQYVDLVPAVEKDKTVDDYDVRLPTLDEDGNPVSSDGGIVGSTRYSLCLDADCGVTDSHVHVNGQVVKVDYQNPYVDYSPVPSYIPDPQISPLGSTAPSTSCGVAGCTETRYHAHNEGRTILLNDPCPVEGCTITGNHIHGDVCYSCNGAGHSGGHCDGSCYTYNNVPEYVSASTGGHHGESHHGNGHH